MSLFTYEEQGDRRYLVYEKRIEDSIDTLTLEMMSNNRIEGVVPSNPIRIDDRLYMKYDITGMQNLREYLKGIVDRQKILGVLESIADVIMTADDYMLSLSSYILDVDYMYIDSAAGSVSMIVLPIVRDEGAIEAFLKELLVDIQYDQTEDCSYVVTLIGMTGNPGTFSMSAFKEQIEQLKKDKGHSGMSQQEQQARPQASQQARPQTSQQARPQTSQQVRSQASQQVWPQAIQQPQVQSQALQQARSQPQESNTWQSRQQTGRVGIELSEEDRKKIVHELKRETNLDILFSDGEEKKDKKEKKGFFFKKEKAEKPEKEKKLEKKSFWGKLTEGKKEKAKEHSEVESMMEGLAIPGLDNPNRQRADYTEKEKPFLQGEGWGQDIAIPAQNVGMNRRAVDIQDFGETVYIGESDDEDTFIIGAEQEAAKPRFILCRNSTKEEFLICEEVTRIGRSSSIAEICITGNRGVGRVHALLYLRNDEVFIEDNNSKNKTYVDGIQLEPGQSPVKLLNGSKIRLGDEEFEFYVQNL